MMTITVVARGIFSNKLIIEWAVMIYLNHCGKLITSLSVLMRVTSHFLSLQPPLLVLWFCPSASSSAAEKLHQLDSGLVMDLVSPKPELC